MANKGSSKYSAKTFARLCERMAAGRSLSDVCRDPGMPHRSSVYAWIRNDPALEQQFREANDLRIEKLVDETIDLPDHALDGCASVSPADRIAHVKLQTQNRQWLAGRAARGKYGSTSTEGSGSGTVTFRLINDPDPHDADAPYAATPEGSAT
jgi:hypothetical protein